MTKEQTKSRLEFSVANEKAAGIDVGSRFHCASVGIGEGESETFGVFTEDLHRLCEWLKSKGITSVAMESTGIYWKQLFLMIQSYGMKACLVNASYTKNIRGRKPSDMADSQWIWKMHSVGLLPSSFQPDNFTEELRTYTRHRKGLLEEASRSVNKMQKCLTLMNVLLPVVLSDITGKSGQDIIEAILSGVQDGAKLAELANPRVKADRETIAKALTGSWQPNYLFELKQHWNAYHFYRKQIADCDAEIDKLLQAKVEATGQADLRYKPKKKKQRQKNTPGFQVEKYAFQLTDGVDLFVIEGVSFHLVLTLISEVGLDLSDFPTAKHFVAWLCLCPDKKVTGGKILSSKTRKNKSLLRQAFRQAAIGLSKVKDEPLAHFYRRMAATKGKGTAITATARKLAIILYNMIKNKQAYNPESLEVYQDKLRKLKIKQIQRTILKYEVKPEDLKSVFV